MWKIGLRLTMLIIELKKHYQYLNNTSNLIKYIFNTYEVLHYRIKLLNKNVLFAQILKIGIHYLLTFSVF